ncbi:MAG: ABC transporter transmembrane domain-containing protein, partial [Croceibacterium sp.]
MATDPESQTRKADPADWTTVRRFLPYLWPAGRPDLRRRIALSGLFVVLAKVVVLALPWAFGKAIDTMSARSETALSLALALVLAYVAGRFATVAFDNVRNIIFERVGQEAVRRLTEDVFRRLHELSLRFHLSRRTGEVTKTVDRGSKSINTMIYFLLFNIAPTAVEMIAVAVIFYLKFGWEMVVATAVTVASYIWVTRFITEWRTQLRHRMNELDGLALARAVDALLNYETVKYFGAEKRELERYGAATRAYAEAAIKSENSLGLLNIAQATLMNLMMAGALAYTVWGWSQGRLSVGDLAMVQMYLTQLFRPLDMLGMVYRTIRQGLIDMALMFKLIDTPVEVQDAPAA